VGRSVMFFAGPNDDCRIRERAGSLGLSVIPPRIDRIGLEPLDGPGSASFWYFSCVAPQELHPYGEPKVRLSDALDPLIQYSRSVYDPPNLIAGRIYWSDDVPEMAAKTKRAFSQLAAWIRRSWERRKQDGYFVGPHANQLAEEEGVNFLYLPPDVEISVENP